MEYFCHFFKIPKEVCIYFWNIKIAVSSYPLIHNIVNLAIFLKLNKSSDNHNFAGKSCGFAGTNVKFVNYTILISFTISWIDSWKSLFYIFIFKKIDENFIRNLKKKVKILNSVFLGGNKLLISNLGVCFIPN